MDKSNRKKRKSKKRKSSKNRIYQLGGGNVNVVLTLKDSNLHYTRQDGSVGGYFDLSNDFNHAVLTESINKLKFASQVHHGESPPYLGMGILTTPLPAMDLVKQINRAHDQGFDASEAQMLLKELSGTVLGFSLTSEQGSGLNIDLIELQELVEELGLDVNTKSVEQTIEALVEYRGYARSDKDFALADSVRDALLGLGIALDDTVDGTTWNMI